MKKLLIIGAGGLGREVAQYVKDINQIKPSFELLGFIDSDPDKKIYALIMYLFWEILMS